MSQVTSILGMPYNLPLYSDKRKPKATFRAAVFHGGSEDNDREFIEITGTRVAFGLVLHRQVPAAQDRAIARPVIWAISEPATGCRIVSGWTRQVALDTLAERVAFLGGEEAFRQAVEAGIRNVLASDMSKQTLSQKKHRTKALLPVGELV